MLGFDLAGPLLAYRIARDHGAGTVAALLIAATLPLIGVVLAAAEQRHLDAIGMTVLAGTGSGAVLSLFFNSPRPTLIFTGVVPLLAFAIACLWSIRRTPLLYQFALTYLGGPDSPRGGNFAKRWDTIAGFRRYFRQITAVWGVAYVVESIAKITIIMRTSTGHALAGVGIISVVVPTTLGLFTAGYAKWVQR